MSLLSEARDRGLVSLRKMAGQATPRVCDFSFDASLGWPEREWYVPMSFEEYGAQHAIKSRRDRGLTDRITDAGVVGTVAAMLRKW